MRPIEASKLRLSSPLLPARFIERPNRFLAIVNLNGKAVKVFTPNPGRMQELLRPGKRLWVTPNIGPHRSTAYDLVLVWHNGCYVGVDSRRPCDLIAEALSNRSLPGFTKWSRFEREVGFNHSRLDFRLQRGREVCYMEVKSVNLVRGGGAMFPDAPTERGARHLRELVEARRRGYRAAVVFVIQRRDATYFTPYEERDPDFARELRIAHRAGVGVVAYRCSVTLRNLSIAGQVPVRFWNSTKEGIPHAQP